MTYLRRFAIRGAAVTAGAALVAVFGFAAPAAAHVTVNPEEAQAGGYARLAFRVPNESDELGTTKLEVFLPEDAPVASLSVQPVPGWTAVVEKRKLTTPIEAHGSQITEAPSKVTWTAGAGAAIAPGQFQEFPVSMGPLPKVSQMVFKALQTYSDGGVVRWIQDPPAAGGEEPERPAPVLKLSAAGAGATASAIPGPAVAEGSTRSDPTARWLGVAGLVAGLAGLALGVVALLVARSRRSPAA